tara:strand:- start:11 stop:514 length:504 start_codon:yes stop_codon:yes gene_type:complete
MNKWLLFVLLTGVVFCQVDSNKVSGFINSFNRDKMKLAIKENESIFKIDNFENPQVKFGNYFAFNNYSAHHHNQYFKVGNKVIIDSNYEKFMYNNNSKYSDIYGKELISRINGPYNTGARYFPLGNGIFNIDARTYNDSKGISEGQSLGIGIFGVTIYEFYKNGKTY